MKRKDETTKAQQDFLARVMKLAEKSNYMRDSAVLSANDAMLCMERDLPEYAGKRAIDSLSYSVNAFCKEVQEAKQLFSIK